MQLDLCRLFEVHTGSLELELASSWDDLADDSSNGAAHTHCTLSVRCCQARPPLSYLSWYWPAGATSWE